MKRARATAISTQKASPDPNNFIGGNTGVAGRLNHIHHDLNHISGGLVLRMTRRNLSKVETLEWCKTLRRLADELEAIVT
jgi:hypothetical protein